MLARKRLEAVSPSVAFHSTAYITVPKRRGIQSIVSTKLHSGTASNAAIVVVVVDGHRLAPASRGARSGGSGVGAAGGAVMEQRGSHAHMPNRTGKNRIV